MGTEFVLLFIPVIPIFFLGALLAVFRKRNNFENGKIEITLLIVAFLDIAYVFSVENLVQGFAFIGLVTFFALLIVLPIIALYKTREKRVKESQWSFHNNEQNEKNT